MVSKKAKAVLSNCVSEIKDNRVALLLSKGIDSSSILFALLEQKKEVIIYSFTLMDRESTDFLGAKKIAKTFNCEFKPIYLPIDINTLKQDVLHLINDRGLRKKTDIECTWTMLYALRSIEEKTILAGLGADGHFVISKKGCIHYKHTVELMNEFRTKLFFNPNYSQKQIVMTMAKEQGKTIVLPYLSEAMIETFKDTSWEQLNKPKQKQVLLDMYPDCFKRIKVHHHTNFQLGDSGIAEHFKKLLNTDWNSRGVKTVVSLYNAVARGEIR